MTFPTTILYIGSKNPVKRFFWKGCELMKNTDEMHEGMLIMQDGRVMIVENGELVPIEEDITLPDGTRVMPDGTVVTTDGKRRLLAHGETLRKFGATANSRDMPGMGPTEEMTGTETHDPS
jgi:hypothetical protein